MNIQTERLKLSNLEKKYTNQYYQYYNSEHVMKYNCMKSKTKDEIEKYIEKNIANDDIIAITLNSNDLLIGMIYINEDSLRYNVESVEISFWLGIDYINQGYMTEALGSLLNYLFFARNFESITARVFSKNIASLSLLKKLNFNQEGILYRAIKTHNNVVYDDVLFSLCKNTYKE